jgi:hypothetical protein
LRLAEECERQAATCASASNRDLFLYTAANWRKMAAELQADAAHEKPGLSRVDRPEPRA